MINRIINIGIDDTIDLYQKKETRLLNLFVIIILSSILLCFVNIVFAEGIYQILLELALVVFSLLVLYLNFKRKYNFSLINNLSLQFFLPAFEQFKSALLMRNELKENWEAYTKHSFKRSPIPTFSKRKYSTYWTIDSSLLPFIVKLYSVNKLKY